MILHLHHVYVYIQFTTNEENLSDVIERLTQLYVLFTVDNLVVVSAIRSSNPFFFAFFHFLFERYCWVFCRRNVHQSYTIYILVSMMSYVQRFFIRSFHVIRWIRTGTVRSMVEHYSINIDICFITSFNKSEKSCIFCLFIFNLVGFYVCVVCFSNDSNHFKLISYNVLICQVLKRARRSKSIFFLI